MSDRLSRLCDVDDRGLCPHPFEAVCPLCGRDCCQGHLNNIARVRSVVAIFDGARNEDFQSIASATSGPICCECVVYLRKLKTAPLEDASTQPVLLEAFEVLKARLAQMRLEDK